MINQNNEEELYWAEQEYQRQQEAEAEVRILAEMYAEISSIAKVLGTDHLISYLQQLKKEEEK